MGSTKDELKQRELFIIKKLRKGYSPTYVISKVVEEFGIAETTATSVVYKINAELNKSLQDLSDDAATYIYNVLISTIDDTINDDDRKNRLKALELLSKICKVGEEKTSTDLNIKFSFDK